MNFTSTGSVNMMVLSEQMQRIIRDGVRASPLGNGETRRLTDLGEMYIARSEPGNSLGKEFIFQFSLAIDKVPYKFYRKV